MSEQLAALPDDPNALRQLLFSMAGPDAILLVDDFEGGAFPPKDRIGSIQIRREANGFAPGVTIIDVRTR